MDEILLSGEKAEKRRQEWDNLFKKIETDPLSNIEIPVRILGLNKKQKNNYEFDYSGDKYVKRKYKKRKWSGTKNIHISEKFNRNTKSTKGWTILYNEVFRKKNIENKNTFLPEFETKKVNCDNKYNIKNQSHQTLQLTNLNEKENVNNLNIQSPNHKHLLNESLKKNSQHEPKLENNKRKHYEGFDYFLNENTKKQKIVNIHNIVTKTFFNETNEKNKNDESHKKRRSILFYDDDPKGKPTNGNESIILLNMEDFQNDEFL